MPSLEITAFGVVNPAPVKFTFDAVGTATPHGNTVKNPGPVVFVAVTFNATDAAPSGTPARPPTGTSRTVPPDTAPEPAATPSTVSSPGRVSIKRAGAAKGTNPSAAGK